MTDEMTEPETRLHPRKQFNCRARLSVGDKASLDARTLDISLGGICLLAPEPVGFGQYGVVKFEVAIADAPRQFTAVARSVYSVPSGEAGFKVGFQFVQLDAANTALVNDLMAQP